MSSRYNSSSTSREQSSSSSSADGRIYVGNLPPDVREKDIEDLFFKYGRISNIDLKSRSPGPSFAFIEFEDRRDAEDAIYYRNGYNYDSCRLRVERPRGGGPRGAYSGHGGGGGGGGGSSSSSSWGRRGGAPPRRSDYRCTISDLPSTGSWQDLKDHMRAAGDVCYADVYRDCTGVVEYVNEDDMRYAVKNLDDTKFRSHEGDTTRIIVKADFGGGRSRSRSPVRRYSPKRRSHSPKRSRRSYSKSSSRSRSKSKGRDSRSRSRSRSR